jgi:hypothetical protein
MTKFVTKMRGLSTILVFKDFGVASLEGGQKFNFPKSLSAVQSRNSAMLSTSRSRNS